MKKGKSRNRRKKTRSRLLWIAIAVIGIAAVISVVCVAGMLATKENAWILDPFSGSATTGIAANILGRRYLGLEQSSDFLELSKQRRIELDDISTKEKYKEKIYKYSDVPLQDILEVHESEPYYGIDLPIEQ